jgi:hypothetical protein
VFVNIITDFLDWCNAKNVKNIDLKKCYYIFEEFVKSNEHIIQKINHQQKQKQKQLK